jgi:glucan phosphoethanolaminetransferase (alkaline phosphatase superfamily)
MPLFLNTHWHPRDIDLSYQRPANLFALAKRNGFQTYLYSVQRRHILMLGGLELVDSISTVDERWSEYERRRDDLLVDDLEGMPNGERRFVFLHQHVNHAPYRDHCRHAPETDLFTAEGPGLDDQREAEYDNGLRCYDRNLAKIFEYFSRQPGAVHVFVTADHNDLAGEFDKWGHLSNHPANAYVPMMLFTNRPDGPIAQAFRDIAVMTHFEMSRLIARALGFEVIDPNVRPDTFFVSSSGGFGRDGYLEVHAGQEPDTFDVIQRSGRDEVLHRSHVDIKLDP